MQTLKKSVLAVGLTVFAAMSAGAQNYNNNGYNDNGYNNNGHYDDNNGDNNNDGSYQDFYDDLAPYGQWISDPQYGYVWVPDVSRDFRPYYTNGYWAQTEYGNTWVSNYNWGWATFHYGRWTYDSSYGWVWIPGNEWGPAWVNWRSVDDGYYGWAPMGPGYDVDYYMDNNSYYGPSNWWVFAPQQYLYSSNFYNYARAPRYNSEYLRRSSIVNVSQRSNGYRYFAGPRRADVEHATGHNIPVFRINDMKQAGSTRVVGSSGISMYRPRIEMQGSSSNRSAQSQRPQNFRNAQLNIQEGGARRIEGGNQNGFNGRPPVQQNDPRINNAGQQRNNIDMKSQDQQRIQIQRDQQMRSQQDQQRVQMQNQQRVQQDQQRGQQQQMQDQQRQQMMQQRDVQRTQQQRQQQQQQVRQQQDQQRAQQQQQIQQQRVQQQQMRQQQEQQRSQQMQMRQQEVQRVQQQPQRVEQPRQESRPAQSEGGLRKR